MRVRENAMMQLSNAVGACTQSMHPRAVKREKTMITRYGDAAASGISLIVTMVVTLLVAEAAFGADVTVHVSKRGASGSLDNVAVCLGTRGVPAQFGAVLTDKSGTAKFRNVPRTELVLIASKPGMRGERKSVLASSWNRSLAVSLPAGGGGPECNSVFANSESTTARESPVPRW